MNFFKKSLIFFLALLFCASIYHDITSGTVENEKEVVQTTINKSLNYKVIKAKVLPGRTVLSIVEKYNDGMKSLDVNQIVSDFHQLNEDVNPYELKANHYYYFPVYK